MKIFLDLLPENRKKQLIRKKNFWIIIEQEFLFLFPLIVFLVILGNTLLLLNIRNEGIMTENGQQSSQGKYQELEGYEKDVILINKYIENVEKTQKNHLSWSKVLADFSRVIPEGVLINSLATNDYKVMVVGIAATRDTLMSVKENMLKNDCFADINIPLSNLVAKENIEFQLDFLVKRDCLISK